MMKRTCLLRKLLALTLCLLLCGSALADTVRGDLTGRFDGMPMHIGVAYSGAPEVGRKWQKYVQERFPRCKVQCSALGLSIACHTGPGALGVGCYYYEE